MSSNKMTEGVGKKIVEALKQQSSDVDIIPVSEPAETPNLSAEESIVNNEEFTPSVQPSINSFDEANSNITSSLNMANAIDNAFNRTMMNFRQNNQDANLAAVDDMDLPANVAVLKQLIT